MNLGKCSHPCPMSIWAQASMSVPQSLCCIEMSSQHHSAVVATRCSSQPGSEYSCWHRETLVCTNNSTYLNVPLTELALLVLCRYQPFLALVVETRGLRSFSQDLFVLPHGECLLCMPSCPHQSPGTRELWCPSLVSQGPHLVPHLKVYPVLEQQS